MFRSLTRSRLFSTSAARSDIARFTAIGRIGADVEVLRSKNDKVYVRYPLAVSSPKKDTSWFQVTVFDINAINFMTERLGKGSTVYVEADISLGQYDTESGETRQSLNLVQQTISPVIWKKPEDVAAAGEAASEAA